MNPRCLKIEADGDAWKKNLKPKIRLMGRWLEQMGFPPERHVEVSLIQPGLLQIKLKPEVIEDVTRLPIPPAENGKKQTLHSFEH